MISRSLTTLIVCPVILKNKKRSFLTNIIFDTGSNVTLLTERAARKLKLKGVKVPFSLKGIGNESVMKEEMTDIVQFKAENTAQDFSTTLTDVKVVKEIAENVPAEDWNNCKEKYNYMKDIELQKPVRNGQIDLLIGTDNMELLIQKDIRKGKLKCVDGARRWPGRERH